MRLIRGLPHLPAFKSGCVLTIGNFDGVHLGHKAVIEKLVGHGKTLGLPVVILIFEPQPLEYFLGDNAPPRLTRLREKVIQFTKLPVDDLVIVRFNKQLAVLVKPGRAILPCLRRKVKRGDIRWKTPARGRWMGSG
jgi:riboflavin kinase/FMN adenylyltransferase